MTVNRMVVMLQSLHSARINAPNFLRAFGTLDLMTPSLSPRKDRMVSLRDQDIRSIVATMGS